MDKYPSARALAQQLVPNYPVTCLRPHAIQRAVGFFLNAFPGEVLYAVKTNPGPEVLDVIYGAGVRRFDVASMAEIELISGKFPDARMSYMNPVKNRDAIRQAYFRFGIRDFVLDSEDELRKIVEETGGATDLNLLVRLAVPNHHSELDLSSKYGIGPEEAPDLLAATRRVAAKLGVAFHVGSQCMNPQAYVTALNMVRDLVHRSGILLEIVDVGGGFPSVYPELLPPAMADYMREISAAIDKLPVPESCEIWCEPGRALSAEGQSTLVRVESRRGDRLYINDGTYGSLFDAGALNLVFPMRPIRLQGEFQEGEKAFSLFGPTCDGMDFMKGPFNLPGDIREGDYIEIGQTGAYGNAMRTKFNGFHSDAMAEVQDAPLMSVYGKRPAQRRPAAKKFASANRIVEHLK